MHLERQGRELLRRNHVLDQRDQDWHAGFFAALDAVLTEPGKAAERLESALKRLERNG